MIREYPHTVRSSRAYLFNNMSFSTINILIGLIAPPLMAIPLNKQAVSGGNAQASITHQAGVDVIYVITLCRIQLRHHWHRPQNIAKEGIEQVKTFARTEFDTATASLRDERGGWKLDKLLLVGGAVVGVIVFAVTLNQVATRRSLASAARKAIEK